MRDKDSRGSGRSGMGCQGWELRGGRVRATSHVSIPEDCRPAPTQRPRAWLGSIFTNTLPPPGPLPLEAVSACSLAPRKPSRLGPPQGPTTSAPAALACPCLGCVPLWLTARALSPCLPLIRCCIPAPGTGLVNSKHSLCA